MIVIPMAGLSSRFFNAGYSIPKYMLPLGDYTVFERSVMSFEKYFGSDEFVFICRDIYSTPEFIESQIKKLSIKNYRIVTLKRETIGQAETVVEGLKDYKEIYDLTIFNIDTFRPGFIKPTFISESCGYLETFIGFGKNWSNILPGDGSSVLKTAEKQEISQYCCTGLYQFSKFSLLMQAFDEAKKDVSLLHNGEAYIAPLYNYLINNGKLINYSVIDHSDVIFCGTPSEYKALLTHEEF